MSRERIRAKSWAHERRERKPVSGLSPNLDFEAIPGFSSRVVTDTGGKLQHYLDRGWRFRQKADAKKDDGVDYVHTNTTTDLGSCMRAIVNKSGGTEGVYGYVMDIPIEWYEENQRAKEKEREKTMEQIRDGQFNRESNDGRTNVHLKDQIKITQ